jgi:hypothetical protein
MFFKQFLLNNWADIFKENPPADIDCVLLSSCLEDHGNNLIMVFSEHHCHFPKYIMKTTRNKKFNFKIETEFEALKKAAKDDFLRPYIPYPYMAGYLNGCAYLIQEGIRGRTLHDVLCARKNTPLTWSLVNQAIEILIKINGMNTSKDIENKHPGMDRALSLLPAAVLTETGLSIKEIDLIVETRDTLFKKNRFFIHNDYWGANILVNERNMSISGIVDWEFSTATSPVPSDIVWFVVNLIYALNITRQTRSFYEVVKTAFFTPESMELIKRCLNRYTALMEIEEIDFIQWIEAVLLEMGLRELKTYGQTGVMDKECLQLLKFIINNRDKSFFLKTNEEINAL